MSYLYKYYLLELLSILVCFSTFTLAEKQPFVPTGIYTLHHNLKAKINPNLSKAYAAYQRGDEQTAQRAYGKVLEKNKNNRDALLGLAALALNRGDSHQAQAYYKRILRLYPQDTIAQVNLINILGNYQNESQLKLLLLEVPQSAYIYFSLGNLYAQQTRWAHAQQAFLKALVYDKSQADYAYNLAVSYEHLNQLRLALNYYQRTLELANKQSVVNFNLQTVQKRIHHLKSVIRK